MAEIAARAIAALLLVACGCTATGGESGATDTMLHGTMGGASATAAATDSAATDTLAFLPAEVAPVPPPPAARGDTLPISPAEGELAQLRAALVVPVAGVAAADLRDSYTEARGRRSHEALDILVPRGTPVLSATDGRLTKIHESAAGGRMVYAADASDRFILMYAHLDRYADGLVEGMPLRRGQVIGYVGTSGNAAPGTPHLHFAIARGRPSTTWWRGTPVNPYPLLAPR